MNGSPAMNVRMLKQGSGNGLSFVFPDASGAQNALPITLLPGQSLSYWFTYCVSTPQGPVDCDSPVFNFMNQPAAIEAAPEPTRPACPVINFSQQVMPDPTGGQDMYKIVFTPQTNMNLAWVDLHLRMPGRDMINIRMTKTSANSFEYSGSDQPIMIPQGTTINYFFTYCVATPQGPVDCDTPMYSYQPAAPAPAPVQEQPLPVQEIQQPMYQQPAMLYQQPQIYTQAPYLITAGVKGGDFSYGGFGGHKGGPGFGGPGGPKGGPGFEFGGPGGNGGPEFGYGFGGGKGGPGFGLGFAAPVLPAAGLYGGYGGLNYPTSPLLYGQAVGAGFAATPLTSPILQQPIANYGYQQPLGGNYAGAGYGALPVTAALTSSSTKNGGAALYSGGL
jgi:hypothetical protein